MSVTLLRVRHMRTWPEQLGRFVKADSMLCDSTLNAAFCFFTASAFCFFDASAFSAFTASFLAASSALQAATDTEVVNCLIAAALHTTANLGLGKAACVTLGAQQEVESDCQALPDLQTHFAAAFSACSASLTAALPLCLVFLASSAA